MATTESAAEQVESISLFHRMQKRKKLPDLIEIAREICNEVKRRHRENGVVRNLSPKNIFIGGQHVSIDQSADSLDSEWPSPDSRHTRESDIYLLGCLLFYIWSGGQHPFGESLSRNQLMSANLFLLKGCKDKNLQKLIEKMISKDPGKRPSIEEVCDHPVFWNSSQITSFLKAFATDFQNDPRINQLSNNLSKEVLQPTLITQVKKRKKLDIKSIVDILQEIKSTENESDVLFWHKTFPNLFPAVYLATETSESSMEEPHAVEFDYMLVHRLEELKFSENVEQIKLRPGRFGDQFVNVIVIPKCQSISGGSLEKYSTTLQQMCHLNHGNVMAQLFTEEDLENCYIAIEPITTTLSTASNFQQDLVKEQFKSIFYQLAKGLTYLHSKEIVHGTLSPDEIVIEIQTEEILVKIAKLTPGQDIWGSPTASEEDDVRRLGCVAYWIQSRDHPFGNPEDRFKNIQQKLYKLQNLPPVAHHLIWSMVDHSIPCNAVLFHPFFWSVGKIVNFFQAAHNFAVDFPIDHFPISFMGESGSDRPTEKWLNSHSGIPQNSKEALESFVLQMRDSRSSVDFEEKCVREWSEFFPDFLLQMWILLQEHKDSEELCAFYYAKFDFQAYPELKQKQLDNQAKQVCIKTSQPIYPKGTNLSSSFVELITKRGLETFFDEQIQMMKMRKGAHEQSSNPNELCVIDRETEWSMLHLASESDDYYPWAKKMVQELRIDPNIKNTLGVTPLHLAALKNALKVAKLLLKNRAIADVLDKQLLTPLYLAVVGNSVFIAKLMLEALRSKPKRNVNARDQHGRTALLVAAHKGSFEMVELLLTDPKVDLCAKDSKGFTALHMAAARNDVRIIELLLWKERERNQEISSIKDNEGNSALHIAAANKAIEAAVKLLSLNDVNERNYFGCTPLYLAANNQAQELAILLLESGSDFKVSDENGTTVLHIAVHHRLHKLVHLLLEKGCNPNAQNKDNLTPLYMAQLDSLDIIRALLEHRASSDIVGHFGWSFWHLAAAHNKEEVIDVLLALDKEHINIKSKNAQSVSPLHIAAYKNFESIAAKLIKNGAQVDSLDGYGDSPIFYAAARNSRGVAKMLLSLKKNVKLVGKKKAQIAQIDEKLISANTRGNNGRTPLHVAALAGAREVAEILIKFGADINSRDELKMTALHYAVYRKHDQFVDFLIEKPKIEKFPLSLRLLPKKLALLPIIERINLPNISINVTFGNVSTVPPIADVVIYQVLQTRAQV